MKAAAAVLLYSLSYAADMSGRMKGLVELAPYEKLSEYGFSPNPVGNRELSKMGEWRVMVLRASLVLCICMFDKMGGRRKQEGKYIEKRLVR